MAGVFQPNIFQNNVFQVDVASTSTGVDRSDGKPRGLPRGRKRRHRNADEELTEAEVQFIRRKVAELKAAKTEREKVAAAKALEIALAQAAQDDEVADVISAEIQEKRPEIKEDYGPIMRDVPCFPAFSLS